MKLFSTALLFALISQLAYSQSEKIPYGNNPAVGKYFDVGDAKLYYEIYGTGEPFVLLHGGVYGYIDEFEPFINELSKKYQVICVATRGHGKSEIGNAPFTWQQRAEDAYKVVHSITQKPFYLLGFSDGGYSAYKLAAIHPELVKKLIVIGASDRPKGNPPSVADYTAEKLLGQSKDFFEGRLALMPEPNRWNECLQKLNKLYNEDYLSKETFEKIKSPTLVMSGEKDGYHTVEHVKRASEMIKGSQLHIVKNCDHVVFFCDWADVWGSVSSFLNK